MSPPVSHIKHNYKPQGMNVVLSMYCLGMTGPRLTSPGFQVGKTTITYLLFQEGRIVVFQQINLSTKIPLTTLDLFPNS